MVLRLLKLITLLIGVSLMVGCKLAVMVPPGGQVQSSSGTRSCDGGTEGKFCTFDLSAVSLPYSESFTALAKPGYQFEKWQDGGGFQCANSTSPTCTVAIADDPFGAIVRAMFDMGRIMPIYKDIGIDTDSDGVRNELDDDDDNDGILDIHDSCPLDPSPDCSIGTPITDTVFINGREWAQVDLFTRLS